MKTKVLTDPAWVEQKERRHAMTLEALESIGAGMSVPHEAVVNWAKRLGTDDAVPSTDQG